MFDPALEKHYDTDPIDSGEGGDLQMLISATRQADNIICYDQQENIINPQEVFISNFPELVYREWDDFDDNTKINCNPNWKGIEADDDDYDE